MGFNGPSFLETNTRYCGNSVTKKRLAPLNVILRGDRVVWNSRKVEQA